MVSLEHHAHMLGRSSRASQHIFNLHIASNSMIFVVSVCTFVKLGEWSARVVILSLLAIGSATESCTLTISTSPMMINDYHFKDSNNSHFLN
jgi:hypothetical protein